MRKCSSHSSSCEQGSAVRRTHETTEGTRERYKARLVVQGCQEDKGCIRADAATGSRDAFCMALSAAAQDGWDYNVFDAQSVCLQPDGVERLLLCNTSISRRAWRFAWSWAF